LKIDKPDVFEATMAVVFWLRNRHVPGDDSWWYGTFCS